MKTQMNCLITSIGSYSGEAVISSLKKNRNNTVVGCDLNPSSWISTSKLVDTFYQVPISYQHDQYIKRIKEIISKENIDYIIPLTDPEVDLLSEKSYEIENEKVTICIPSLKAVELCRNKSAFYDFFKNDSRISLIPTFKPEEYPMEKYGLPAIAKPKRGRSSEGLLKIENEETYFFYSNRLNDYVIQPFLRGDIYTVDIIRKASSGKSIAIPRKELLRTKNGAGLTVQIDFNQSLIDTAIYIGHKLDINGCINMEFILSNGIFYLMDINPRFSAGVSFSILAGYDMITNHLNCFGNNNIDDLNTYNTVIITKKFVDIVTSTI